MSTDSSNGQNNDSMANASSIREERSEDSDSAGSLADFIVSSEDTDDEGGDYGDVHTDDDDVTTQSTALAAELLECLPFETSEAGTVVNSSGLRRSTRSRKVPERYVDPSYLKLMMEDVSSMSEDSDEVDAAVDEAYASEDEDYVFDENGMDVDTETEEEEESGESEGDSDEESGDDADDERRISDDVKGALAAWADEDV